MNTLGLQIVDEKVAKNCWKPVTYRRELKVQQTSASQNTAFFQLLSRLLKNLKH